MLIENLINAINDTGRCNIQLTDHHCQDGDFAVGIIGSFQMGARVFLTG